MIVVIDASVALKWFFQGRADEDHVHQALGVLAAVGEHRLSMIQPPHFLAEIAAVLAREKPASAHDDVTDIQQIDWQVNDDASVYATAVKLSIRFKQHLFDTLYHAVALQTPNAILVTADQRYYRRAKQSGQIELIDEFVSP